MSVLRVISKLLSVVACLSIVVANAFAGEIIENRAHVRPKTTIGYALWGGASEVSSAREVCAEFVRQHPEIRVDVSVYPWGQYWAKVQTQTASGLAPDVMSFYSGGFGVWVARGALLPLDDYVKSSGMDMGEFHPVAVQNCRWNDRLYTMPMEIPIWCLVYSKDRLEESGIPKSQWPRADRAMSWTEFNALAKRLTLRKPDGSFAQYGMAAGQNWDQVMSGLYGGMVVDRAVNPTRATANGNRQLVRAIVELFQAQYADRNTLGAVPLAAGSFAASTDNLLVSPRFAMCTTGPWALKDYLDEGVRVGMAPMPQGPVPSQIINVNSVGIYSHSKHPKEAFELLRFMASPYVQQIFGSGLKGVPALRSARDSFVHNRYGIAGMEAFLHDMEVAKPALTCDNTYVPSARDKWYSSLEQKLDNEYDTRLAALPRRNGAIAPADYAKFVDGMREYVDKTVRDSIPELQTKLEDAFQQAAEPDPTPFVRSVAPGLALASFAFLVLFYVGWVRKNGEKDSATGQRRNNLAGYLFIAPWLFGFACFVLGPILASIALSFTNWNMISAPEWVGGQHYADLLGDDRFKIGLKNTLLYACMVIPISLVGGLFTAGLLSSRIRGSDVFKAIIYFPALFTGAEAAVLWVNMLNKEHGIINYALSVFHIAPVNWMDEAHAFRSVVLMNVFWIGGAMIIYYAGMKQIPQTLYEAADLDGASGARKFLRITIPLLSPVILFMVVMTTIGAFQVFTPALFFAGSSSTIGEPGDALRFYSVNIYDQAFNNLRMGVACSYAIVLFVIIFGITMLQMKLARRFVYTDGAA